MAVFGKHKAGAAVLDAPGESFAQETEWSVREPAPAGMLQRGRLAAEGPGGFAAGDGEFEDVYKPRRESMRYRLRLGVPKTIAGRIVVGAGVVLGLGCVIGAVLAVRAMLLHDERFVVATSSEIQVGGNAHLTRAQVLGVFGSDLERNIFKVPLSERRADLERLPWVQHATVMRLLPNRIRVAVVERTPVAFVRQGTQIGLVDADGVLLDIPEDAAGDPHYSFPVLTGIAVSDPQSTRAARMEIYRKFMDELDSSGEKLTKSLSEVDVSNPEDVKALVASGSVDILVHFGDENFLARYKLFQQNLPQWKTQYPKLASVDTRYESQVVLEMQGGTPVPVEGQQVSELASQPVGGAVDAAAVGAKPVAVKSAAKVAAKKAPVKVLSAKQKMAAQLAAARKPSAKVAKP